MSQTCSICKHPHVEEINRLLLEGVSFRNVAERCSVSVAALFRHKQHIPASLVLAQEAQEIAKADNLLDQVIALKDKAVGILEAAEQAGDLKRALLGIWEAKSCIELLAKLQLVILQQAQANATGPEFELPQFIIQVVSPEAKKMTEQVLKGVGTE